MPENPLNPTPEQPIAPVEPQGSWFAAHKALVSIIIAAIVVAAGVSAYFVMNSQKVNQADLQPVTHQAKSDLTADWKTYISSNYGFSMKYPSTWTVAESVQKSTVFGDLPTISFIDKNDTINIEESEQNPKIYVFVTKDIYSGSVTNYLSKFNKAISNLPVDSTEKIDNHTAYKIDGNTPPATQNFYMVFANNNVYQISGPKEFDISGGNPALEQLASQVIATFKFTDTAATKTYTNSQYGFQFSYPGKYFLGSPLVQTGNGQLGFDDQTNKLNADLPQGSEMFNIHIQDYAKLDPAVDCGNPAENCPESQADINSYIKIISGAKAGDSVTVGSIKDTIVSMSGQKAVRSVYFNPTGGDWDIVVIVYDKNKNEIGLSFSIAAKDQNAAMASQEYKDLTTIIQSFKFTN